MTEKASSKTCRQRHPGKSSTKLSHGCSKDVLLRLWPFIFMPSKAWMKQAGQYWTRYWPPIRGLRCSRKVRFGSSERGRHHTEDTEGFLSGCETSFEPGMARQSV